MCETNVYVYEDGREEPLIESIDVLRPEGEGKLFLRNLFGQEEVFEGRIREICLTKHKIVLQR